MRRLLLLYQVSPKVSIHASVKDATLATREIAQRMSFNPRICKRCDCHFLKFLCVPCGFNPRICKRCDFLKRLDLCSAISFNPRICKRCDAPLISALIILPVSIHASVKDATTYNLTSNPSRVFQSTHL